MLIAGKCAVTQWPWVLAILFAFGLTACGDEEEKREDDEDSCEVDATYQPSVTPANFVTVVDNQFLPLTPGTVQTYQGGGETIVVAATDDTRVVMGVTCIVVRDTVTVGGQTIEDTFDWYAQDSDGNVWYFGEDTKEYENGKVVSTEGSWEGGVDGALPGIVMLANPHAGDVYRQEYYACEAQDVAEVVAQNEDVSVPYGDFTGCLRTRDYTPLDIQSNEYKRYCPNVGLVAEIGIWDSIRAELVSVTP
jgi:hypothetical protein